jgi:uncharacterized protein
MELSELLAALSDPAAFHRPPGTPVDVVQTHISVVFLVEGDVYKLKKPITLQFLDYSTLDLRRRFCELEVSLNRRLAHDVYRGVLPVVRGEDGIRVGGEGEIVDYVVHMRRLPDAAQLGAKIAQGTADGALLERIGARVARFHQGARRGADVARWASFETVADNMRQNFVYLESFAYVSDALRRRVEQLTEAALAEGRAAIERRARCLVPRDTHGDLRLDHVYVFPEEPPPGDLVIVDCIEFGEKLRCTDPVADVAFLSMDLDRVGRHDLARAFTDAYFDELASLGPLGEAEPGAAPVDEIAEGRALLPLYAAYRAAVRAKVEGLTARDPEVPTGARREAQSRVHRYLLLALRELTPPSEHPRLALIMGLPGTGKSTLARALAERGYVWIRSDAVRKELAGFSPGAEARAPPGEGIYTPAWTERTYAACLARARAHLLEGARVVVDANFRTEAQRAGFLELSREFGLRLHVLVCTADEATVEARLAARRGDASDADFAVYLAARAAFEPLGPELAAVAGEVDTGTTVDEALERALALLE